jgi:hypothetical protein
VIGGVPFLKDEGGGMKDDAGAAAFIPPLPKQAGSRRSASRALLSMMQDL